MDGAQHEGGLPQDHLVGFYETRGFLVDSIVDFVGPAWWHDDQVLMIARGDHLGPVAADLTAQGYDVARARRSGRYVELDARRALDAFLVGDALHYDRFLSEVLGVVDRMTADGRHVRVVGEMVALLWEDDNIAGALALEDVWNEVGRTRDMSLFCAYPVSVFAEGHDAALRRVCAAHSSVISEGYAA